jgi:hypothetical protein
MDALRPWYSKAFRAEAPAHRISHEVEKYMTQRIGLYRLLLNIYPYILYSSTAFLVSYCSFYDFIRIFGMLDTTLSWVEFQQTNIHLLAS